jgi:anti-anti-sigma factor
MKLEYTELVNGIRLIKLNGTLDLTGTYGIEVQFVRHCTGNNLRILVDLSGVDFLSSVGIPLLVNTAKSVESHGGKFALLKPPDNVFKVLELVGVPQFTPIYKDMDSAVAGLK